MQQELELEPEPELGDRAGRIFLAPPVLYYYVQTDRMQIRSTTKGPKEGDPTVPSRSRASAQGPPPIPAPFHIRATNHSSCSLATLRSKGWGGVGIYLDQTCCLLTFCTGYLRRASQPTWSRHWILAQTPRPLFLVGSCSWIFCSWCVCFVCVCVCVFPGPALSP
ncbi:uncharacterized protein LY79DRAFT_258296 [Colletotrichum navitas]|uniref:Uncharacterized protein n=1 Tax=Colletotrichum navitas TaxID=681940 RepID=A0AAD8PXB2_9PEZI|nr:uncharacterized protein LY79DRAFT_258296 [Colletotrichum navitas]KAK1585883.1 hypothetical protein LY79DRAFT_258296 [Colletotrichum navitas]